LLAACLWLSQLPVASGQIPNNQYLIPDFFSQLLKKLHPSATAIKPDGHLSGLNNHRNFAHAIGMLEHGVEFVGI
jgi:hypothetical protein